MIEGLPELLRDTTAVSDLVGTRVYPYHAPEGTARPYIVIEQLTSDELNTLDGTTGLRMVDFDIDCKADRATESKALGTVVRDFIKDYSGTAGDQTISAVILHSERTEYEPPTDKSDVGVYTTLLDITVQYTPA